MAALLMLAGCSVAQSRELDRDPIEMEEAAARQTDAVSTVRAGSQTTDDGRWFETWEEAALAEAERLHPGLTNPTAERVNLSTVGERVVVRTADGRAWRGHTGGTSLVETADDRSPPWPHRPD